MGREFEFNSWDGKRIFARSWEVDRPIASVQLMHGMNEHSGRYAVLAEYLNTLGFNMYATDHRGHGRTADGADEIGYIGDKGFHNMVEDERVFSEWIKSDNPDLPHFILGHSMGSFLALRFIQQYGKGISGCILVGSCGNRKDIALGVMVSSLVEKCNGDKRSRPLEKIVFKGYNRRFDKRTRFEWIAKDTDVVDAYLNDPYCGHVFPPSFYRQMLQFLWGLYKPEQMEAIPLDLPIMILSGKEDPVGGFGPGIQRLYTQFQEIGHPNIKIHLYDDVRHEILNDVSKETVFRDIGRWMAQQMTGSS